MRSGYFQLDALMFCGFDYFSSGGIFEHIKICTAVDGLDCMGTGGNPIPDRIFPEDGPGRNGQ